MKILHITPSYVPAYAHGGAVKAVHELCKGLLGVGQEVSVITTNNDGKRDADVPLNKPVSVDGVKVIYCPVKFFRSYYYSKDLKDAVRAMVPQFDIIHIHSVFLYPTAVAAHYCRKYNKPYIINPFGALDPSMIRLKGRLKKLVYMRLIEKRNIEGACAVHVASDYEKKNFTALGLNAPVLVIQRGIDAANYGNDPRLESLVKKYPVLAEKKILLFLGRVHFKKGLDLMVEALRIVAKKRNDVFLVIAGPSEDGYGEKVKKMLSQAGVLNRAIFTGMLLGNDKLSALYGSDLFILPSYGENFGIAVLEAMACGLPVLVSDKVGLYPDIEEYKAGAVTGCDPEKIAGTILRLLADESLRKNMSENGRRLVEDRFTTAKIAGQMIKAYDMMLNGNRAKYKNG